MVRLFHLLKKGNQLLFIGEELISCLAAQACVHFMKIITVYTLNSHLLTLIAHNHKSRMFLSSTELFEAS